MTSMINGAPPAPKQIRFVHNQGQPPSKRRRINAACLTCRKRKTRCAGERPVCSTCTKNGHACLGYNEVIEKKTAGGAIATRDPHHDDDHDDDEEDHARDDEEEHHDERRHWKVPESARRFSTSKPRGDAASRTSSEATAGHSPTFVRRPSESSSRDHDHRRPSHPRTTSFSDDARSTQSRSPMLHHTERHRVPYFRYFGPTAIVPGYKQMVVSVRDRRRSTGGSICATSPSSGSSVIHSLGLAMASMPQHDEEVATDEELPVYDPNDPAPVHALILNLVKTFFVHLGCNYPFLKEEKFMHMVKEKRVEPILVDAVCALAARFSDSPQFAHDKDDEASRSEQGQHYAQRAKAATVDTFPCPTVGAVQAMLMMAYEGFGADQDSALWMYLGLAIRMAVDLGLQKMVGVKYQGEKDPWYTRHWSSDAGADEETQEEENGLSHQEQLEVEQERIDTFWSVFILDRVISSGTGRPVTFRDDDFELALPEPTLDPVSGWPAPFPIFIQIIHLYGRVSDVLNNIRNARDLTQEKWTKLARMEHELTKLYQKQDPRLHFSVSNFKTYLKAGQGTNFILLHFWFHALIIILHQPTLLTPFGSLSRTHQLLPNSRELSMSSAKTIADILAFAELIDPKSFIGNPFTSQPMYIAACAFLMESIANASNPASRETSPPADSKADVKQKPSSTEPKPSTKHSLLASAANQNYSRCYKSLQLLHKYWGGIGYILTALDQKSKGIWDCETYTNEEYESTKAPRRGSIGGRFPHPTSPNVPPIAWSLTGTTNSPNSSLTLMYQNMPVGMSGHHITTQPQPNVPTSAPTPPGNMIYDPIRQSLPEPPPHSIFAVAYPQAATSAMRQSSRPSRSQRMSTSSIGSPHGQPKSHLRFDGLNADATSPPAVTTGPNISMLPTSSAQQQPASFTPPSQNSSNYEQPMIPSASPGGTQQEATPSQHQHISQSVMFDPTYANATYSYLGQGMGPITDVITFENPIDIGSLGLPNEMMPPWLEYLPGDILSLFENNGMDPGG